MWRNTQICGRRNAFIDASCEVEFGPVTGTGEATTPILMWPDFEVLERRTTKMRAGAFNDEELRFDRARAIRCVTGLLLHDLEPAVPRVDRSARI